MKVDNISCAQSLICSSFEDRFRLSECCVEGRDQGIDITALDCVPGSILSKNQSSYEDRDIIHALRIAVGVWGILVAIVGIVGNLFTFAALSHAKQRKRHRLHENWNTTTVFVLNMAAIDLIFCIICIPTYVIPFLTQGWEYGNMPCKGNLNIVTLCILQIRYNLFLKFMC